MTRSAGGTRPLRVLMLNERDLGHPLAGGVEVNLEEIGSRLSRDHAIETTVLCAGFPGGAPEESRSGLRLVRIGRNRPEYYARLPMRARAMLRSGSFDLLVENLCKLVFLSPLWARGVPGLGLAHHLFGTSAFRQVALPTALAVLATEASLPVLYRRWPFVAVSPSTRDDLVRRGLPRANLRVVPNGLDHDLYRPDPRVPGEPGHVVFVGWFVAKQQRKP
ncbi:MAG: glycosyltransferase family 4 protein, partial [Alphaproteobacteria bacterium]